MHRGYIKIWRKLEDSGLLQLPNTLTLFIYMLMKATHKSIRIGTVDLNRGQLVTGRHKLSSELQMSEQSVRTALEKLHKLEMITSESTNRYSVYTIVNYGQYQDIETDDNQQTNQQATNKQPTSNQQATTIQTHKHISIKETTMSEYSEEFEQFWKAYPKKTGKGAAWSSWKKQTPSLQMVLSTLSWQSKSSQWTKENGQFIPMPATYLNQRRWEDAPEGNDNNGKFDLNEWLKDKQ